MINKNSLLLFWFLSLLTVTFSRPVVRSIKDTRQFDEILKKHKSETGFPVIIDFYSDGCGPCRQIAPIYKQVAKQYADKAVFLKVNMNTQHELAQRYSVRSMPTFVFLLDGKKTNEFSGAGEQQLRQFTQEVVNKSSRQNVRITLENLEAYYKQYDEEKDSAAIKVIHTKCGDATKKKSEDCVGGAAADLHKKLKKKYGKGPKMEKRFKKEEKEEKEEEEGAQKGKEDKDKDKDKEKKDPRVPRKDKASTSTKPTPNLHLASLDELRSELEKREDIEREKQDELDEDIDEEEANVFVQSDFPQRVVIIGGGPAGMSAAIYAARAGLSPVIIAPPMGGQLQGKGVDVENYPGLADQTGPGIVAAMRNQAVEFGTTFLAEEVISVDVSKMPYKVVTNTTSVETHSVIIATGAESKWLGVDGEWELRGGGVSSCATCDGFLYKDQDVVVVGGGDTAMEDALVLARTSRKVTVLHRRNEFRASKILAERVLNHASIEVVWNVTVDKIVGKVVSAELGSEEDESESESHDLDSISEKKVVEKVVFVDVNTGAKTTLACNAVFVAIGHEPNSKIVDGKLEFNKHHKGYLAVEGGTTRTSVEGVFAAGDISDAVYRQAITSAGAGAAAALEAERWLAVKGLGNEEADFEASLLEDMREEVEVEGGGGYNAYSEGNAGAGRKESAAV